MRLLWSLPTLIRRQNYCASVATLLSKQTLLTIFRDPPPPRLTKNDEKIMYQSSLLLHACKLMLHLFRVLLMEGITFECLQLVGGKDILMSTFRP
jgi:hypothetical protein